MIRLIDAHVHLNDEAYAADLEAVLDRARAAGVARLVVAGYDAPSSRAAVDLASSHEEVWAAVGVSPHAAASWNEETAREIAALARAAKVVAVGEIGLDYHYDFAPRGVQRAVFRAQLALAASCGRPVVVHNREAHADTLAILAEQKAGVRGVMHCFSGSLETALTAWQQGFRISFAGPLTFKNADRLRAIAARLPREALLVETDAPYLAPHPHRGRRNEPANVRLVLEALAAARGEAPEATAEAVWENAARTFDFARGRG
ncbi:MAG: TatD family hydrolase [Bacteroidota bacterium]